MQASGLFGKFGNTDRSHSRHSCVKKIRRRPCYACIFSPCSDDCGCEKFVTELPAQPTSYKFRMKKPDSLICLFSAALLALSVAACDSDGDARELVNLLAVADEGFTSIVINGDTDTIIETGQSTSLSLTAFTDDGLTGTVISATSADWSSSNDLIAEVDENTGIVFGRDVDGEALITASFANLSATTQVRVSSAQLETIIIQPPAAALNECSDNQFTALGVFQGEAEQRDITDTIEWSVTQGNAVFDEVNTGLLRVTSTDALSVTATRAAFLDRVGVTQTDTVMVLDNLAEINIMPDAGTLTARSSLQYRAFAVYADQPGVNAEITDNVDWSIVDIATSGDFADVDNVLPGRGLVTPSRAGDGVLTANCAGTNISQSVNISAEGSGEFASLRITAENSERDFPLQITWLGEEIEEQLFAEALFRDQDGGVDVTDDGDTDWVITSDPNNVFTIGNDGGDSGELTINGVGTATIEVTFIDDDNDGAVFMDEVMVVSQ